MNDVDSFLGALDPPKRERRPGDFLRDERGVPYVAHPTKVRKDGQPWMVRYGRPSSFGKRIENTYNLMRWSERMTLWGALSGDRLGQLDALHGIDVESDEWKAITDQLVVEAKDRAGALLAAERGTLVHELTERDDLARPLVDALAAGEDLGLGDDVSRALLDAWRTMLADEGLDVLAVELTVVNDRYRQAGTLDRIARLTRPLTFALDDGELVTIDAGTVVVLDLKTGKMSTDKQGRIAYWHSYAVQVATYATSVGYDCTTEQRYDLGYDVSHEWALIAHLPVLDALNGDAHCELVAVSVVAGLDACELCDESTRWFQRHDVFGRQAQPATAEDETLLAQLGESVRLKLQERIDWLKTFAPEHAEWLLRSLVALGVPTLKQSDDHDADQLATMTSLVHEAEARAVRPWTDDDLGRTTSREAALEQRESPLDQSESDEHELERSTPRSALDADDGPPVEHVDRAQLEDDYLGCTNDERAWIKERAIEAAQAGWALDLRHDPKLRRVLVVRALIAVAHWHEAMTLDEGELRDVLDEVTNERWSRALPLGALVGWLTIDEARRLAEAYRPMGDAT